ncbi:TetR/AcrR family transcriptional regulator [Sphingobium lactosutens]|uniref:TetR/AcrR family transcriptional regulator n=1 Tax=Sphingobium lactosutens TaxID=522773 RepID=UPI0015C116E4|nr:TetR/AcrR family transcriptional regulator [Sphingobium lactosutens]NWK97420.1 TetR/AcrR family transcriptional regulator [Sphingobium lactosutens]
MNAATVKVATKQPGSRKSRRLNLTRAERSDLVKRRLFDAAIKVVGENGYAEASVSRITRLAGVAQGTFYNHFPNRQDLLDQLLPTVGERMLAYIGERIGGIASETEKEVARFRAFFDFLVEVPQFMRILNEAQIFAPVGYQQHIDSVSKNYMRALRRGGMDGSSFSPAELEVIVHIMLGARNYLSHHYSYTDSKVHAPDEAVFTAYEKFIRFGVFWKQTEDAIGPG